MPKYTALEALLVARCLAKFIPATQFAPAEGIDVLLWDVVDWNEMFSYEETTAPLAAKGLSLELLLNMSAPESSLGTESTF